MVNQVVDGYTKTLNHRKILQKCKKKNLLKTKRILKLKYKPKSGPGSKYKPKWAVAILE